MGHHGTRSYDRVSTNTHSGKYRSIHPNVRAGFHDHWPDHETGRDDRVFNWLAGVR